MGYSVRAIAFAVLLWSANSTMAFHKHVQTTSVPVVPATSVYYYSIPAPSAPMHMTYAAPVQYSTFAPSYYSFAAPAVYFTPVNAPQDLPLNAADQLKSLRNELAAFRTEIKTQVAAVHADVKKIGAGTPTPSDPTLTLLNQLNSKMDGIQGQFDKMKADVEAIKKKVNPQ